MFFKKTIKVSDCSSIYLMIITHEKSAVAFSKQLEKIINKNKSVSQLVKTDISL